MLVGRFHPTGCETCHLVKTTVLGMIVTTIMPSPSLVLSESFLESYPQVTPGTGWQNLSQKSVWFWKCQSTIDMVFTLCLLQEKSIKQNNPLDVVFVDLKKVFETVSRSGFYKVLERIGPPKASTTDLCISQQHVDSEISEGFRLKCRVKQGCHSAYTL